MTCPDCITARRVRWHGGYHAHCCGCKARAIARSTAAQDARGAGVRETPHLHALVSRMLPALSAEAALRAVWEWWAADHEAPEGIAA